MRVFQILPNLYNNRHRKIRFIKTFFFTKLQTRFLEGFIILLKPKFNNYYNFLNSLRSF